MRFDVEFPGPLSPDEGAGGQDQEGAGQGAEGSAEETSDILSDVMVDFPGGSAREQSGEEEEEETETPDTERPEETGEEDSRVIREMRARLRRQDKELKKLRSEMTEKGKDGDKKERLSRQQLLGLLKEHEGNPEVLLNIIEYMRDMGTEDTKQATEATAKRAQVLARAEDYCAKIHKDYGDDDSELMTFINANYMDQYELTDHPYARPLGLALWVLDNLPRIMQKQTKQGAATEQARRQKVPIGTGLPSGGKKQKEGEKKPAQATLTAKQKKVARELGINETTYAQMLKAS